MDYGMSLIRSTPIIIQSRSSTRFGWLFIALEERRESETKRCLYHSRLLLYAQRGLFTPRLFCLRARLGMVNMSLDQGSELVPATFFPN